MNDDTTEKSSIIDDTCVVVRTTETAEAAIIAPTEGAAGAIYMRADQRQRAHERHTTSRRRRYHLNSHAATKRVSRPSGNLKVSEERKAIANILRKISFEGVSPAAQAPSTISAQKNAISHNIKLDINGRRWLRRKLWRPCTAGR